MSIDNIELAREKHNEARYFLNQMRKVDAKNKREPHEFRYNLSAFLSASHSICNFFSDEGVGSFKDWAGDAPVGREMNEFFESHRHAVVHLRRRDNGDTSYFDRGHRIGIGDMADTESKSRYYSFSYLPNELIEEYRDEWVTETYHTQQESIPVIRLCDEYLSLLDHWISDVEDGWSA